MLLIEKEIHQQPDVLQGLLEQETEPIKKLAKIIREFDPAFVSIAARGTSDNAARYAQYLLGAYAGLPVALATPSLHTLYESPPNLSKGLVIGISQSGKSEDVRQVLEDARKQGALTLAVTNNTESPMAQTAQYHVALHAGEEESIAATKTYTAQLMVMAMLAAELSGKDEPLNQLEKMPDSLRQTLQQSQAIAGWIERYRYIEHIVGIGRGFNYCTAFEIILKIKELCYVSGHGYSEADFRHGPIAQIQRGFPVIVVATKGKTIDIVTEFLQKLEERGAENLVISNVESCFQYAQKSMPIPDMPEWLSPIAAVVPGQIFTMHLALAKGYDVDHPFGLTKVTYTR